MLDTLGALDVAAYIAVEPDPGNFELLEENLRPYAERGLLVHAAVGASPGRTGLAGTATNAYRLAPGDAVELLTLDGLLERAGWDRADYAKVDIEGAERDVFRAGGVWPAMVDCLRVELHDGYDARGDLEALGYRVGPCVLHPDCLLALARSQNAKKRGVV